MSGGVRCGKIRLILTMSGMARRGAAERDICCLHCKRHFIQKQEFQIHMYADAQRFLNDLSTSDLAPRRA